MNVNIKEKRWLADVSHYGIIVLPNIKKSMSFVYQFVPQKRDDHQTGTVFEWKSQYYIPNHYYIWQCQVVNLSINKNQKCAFQLVYLNVPWAWGSAVQSKIHTLIYFLLQDRMKLYNWVGRRSPYILLQKHLQYCTLPDDLEIILPYWEHG